MTVGARAGDDLAQEAISHSSFPSSPPLSVSAPYLAVLASLVVVIVAFDRVLRQGTPKVVVTREFKSFQQAYLRVYMCALGAEWLQDSHLFALLLRHGHEMESVASLFAVGFVVSYLWGALADLVPGGAASLLGGRRSACLVCFALYGGAALTVLHDDFGTLLVGRVLYGTGTALLHTVFDAWMNVEHATHAFPDDWLMDTYQQGSHWTTAVSIGAGVVAELAASVGGLTAPFVVSLGLCVLGAFLITKSWPPSHERCSCAGLGEGLSGAPSTVATGVRSLSALVHESRGAGYLIVIQACFEAVMYLTLFMWTPALSFSAAELWGIGIPPPYGLIFSSLMAALMLGSLTFRLVTSKTGTAAGPGKPSPDFLLRLLCVVAGGACLCLATVGVTNHWLGLAALLVFEFCVGMYYMLIGWMRGKHVPRTARALVAQSSKTLLAALVLGLLLNCAETVSIAFLLCAVLIAVCYATLYHASAELDAAAAAAAGKAAAQAPEVQSV